MNLTADRQNVSIHEAKTNRTERRDRFTAGAGKHLSKCLQTNKLAAPWEGNCVEVGGGAHLLFYGIFYLFSSVPCESIVYSKMNK